MKKYNPIKIEKKIQKYWEKKNIFKTKINKKWKKFYCLSMMPYPSGKLHMGHVRNYTISDIIARYQRLNKKNVLHPIGWDAFGLPAENAAIENNLSPKKWTKKNIKYMKNQLKILGISYDWNKEITTCKSNYYKWEQLLFIKLFNKKLIYKKKDIINWCPKDSTVLANEQVIKGKCWRCNSIIKYKKISQWYIKITKYANKLFYYLNKLKKWPKKVINMQKKWIGKINGIEINFFIPKINKKIKIFSSKIELIINSICISISINHKIIKFIKIKNNKIINIFKKKNNNNKNKNKCIGIYTKLNAINPINKKKIPIWITNFTNELYNTNIILININNNKKHDFFIKKYNIKNILNINNNIFNKKKIYKKLIKKKIKFNIKDWVISRQRYWGVPIPILYYKKNFFTISKKKLPIKLPKIKNNKFYTNFLKKNKEWKYVYINKKKFKRETDTLDTFVESSWYYLRYTSPKYKINMFDIKKANYWLPINIYIGGIEHATMHLIYIRFIHKFLKKIGLIKTNEPIKKLICQGMVISDAFYYIKNNKRKWVNFNKVKKIKKNKSIQFIKKKDNIKLFYVGKIKMSKSKNNGVNPNKIIKKYGADTLRLFIIFSSPIEKNLEWNENNIKGCYRFLNKLWNLIFNFIKIKKIKKKNINNKKQLKIKYILNKTIKYVTYDIEKKNNLNTSISKIMIFLNKIINFKINNKIDYNIIKKCINKIIILLYPFTPHISFYLWNIMKNKKNIDNILWPKFNKKYINIEIKIKIAIQINGKTKNKIYIKNTYNKEKIINKIKKKKIINKFIKNKIKKIIKKKKNY